MIAVLLSMLFGFAASASALTDIEKLGGLIYRDTDLSLNFNQSCMTCHHPSAGFEDPVNRRDPYNFPVSEGSVKGLFGGRNAPSAAYAGFSPIFRWDDTKGSYVGGMFWDGRATGDRLGDPLAEQAQGPFLNPVEMALASAADVVAQVKISNYASLFESVFLNTNWDDAQVTYDNIAIAIAAFERSQSVTRFTSKFDTFWKACVKKQIDISTINETTNLSKLPQNILSNGELKGLALFNGKAKCAACHVTTDYKTCVIPPLFTDYTYDNLGVPTNQRVYDLAGGSPPDLGLGGRLGEQAQNGKFKVPTLRNVAKSAPYSHNGYFATLSSIVNFYNMRDVEGSIWSTIEPEVRDNVNSIELGNLGLTANEEKNIVAFMQALTDK